ncbi:MAG: YfiR family protein [Burkholderiales bacterium]|jgi:hypothetical protein|nr:YfiR family protein [Burkholderiales bacterium]
MSIGGAEDEVPFACTLPDRRAPACSAGCRRRALAGLLLAPFCSRAEDISTSRAEEAVEAVFMRSFTRYVTWPPHAFAEPNSPWSICVVGSDRFDEVLDRTFAGRTELGRPFGVTRARTSEELLRCHIVFVGYDSPMRRRAALEGLKHRPVLTVGDAPDFLFEGGIIRFVVHDRVAISINLDEARSSSLGISTKMLEVAREVVDNGTLRRLR